MKESKPNEPKSNGFRAKYALNGKESDVKHLILHRDDATEGEMVVFIGHDLELDWECDDKAGKLLELEPIKTSLRHILNGVAALETVAYNWPSDLKLMTKRLLGEAIASALQNDISAAEDVLENARKHIKAKSRQVSRYWILQACLIAGAISGLFGFIEILARDSIRDAVGHTPFLLSLSFWAGCVGALLFVVLRLGRQPSVDTSAERHLHYLEAVARIVGGGISGVLVGGMVTLGLILPVFGQTGKETLATCVAAMIAGASERLAAGIVTKNENVETPKPENADASN